MTSNFLHFLLESRDNLKKKKQIREKELRISSPFTKRDCHGRCGRKSSFCFGIKQQIDYKKTKPEQQQPHHRRSIEHPKYWRNMQTRPRKQLQEELDDYFVISWWKLAAFLDALHSFYP